MTQSTSSDTRPGKHPAFCHPLYCTLDDPNDPLHGAEPVELIFADAGMSLGLFTCSAGPTVELTAQSTRLVWRCECGRNEPLYLSVVLTDTEVLEFIARLSGLLSLGGAA